MAPDVTPPKFLSQDFHTRFFPQVLRNRLHLKIREGKGTTFTSTTEMFISLTVCVILAIIGIPSAVKGSVVGWMLSILGVGGVIVLVIVSFMGQRGERPTYGDFLIGVFLFFFILGVFLGIPVGMETHSFWFGLLTSVAGLIIGYVIGIFAGLWLQHLGWFAIVINMIAALGAIVLCGAALFMLIILVI